MLSSMLLQNVLPGVSHIYKKHSTAKDIFTVLFHLDQFCLRDVPGRLLLRSPKSVRPNLELFCMGVGENIGRQDAQICQDKLSLSMCTLFCGIDNLSCTKYLLERCSYGRIVGFVLVLQIASPLFLCQTWLLG